MNDFLAQLSSFSDDVLRRPENGVPRLEIPPLATPAPNAPNTPLPAPAPAPVVAPLAPEQKLAQDLSLIDQALSNPNTMALVNLSRERGNNLTKDNQVLADRKSMSPADFILKYGDDVYQKVNVLDIGQSEVRGIASASRYPGEWATDNIINIGSGLAQSVGGIAAFGVGLANNKAGVVLSQAMKKLKEGTDSLQSSDLNRRRLMDAMRGELDKRDSAAIFENQKRTDGEFIASLKSLGRGIVSGAGRLVEDPVMLETGVSEAFGSLLAGGPISKGVSAGANFIGSKLATRVGAVGPGAMGGAAARAAQSALDKAAFPLTIGAMEAGSAYSQTINEVMELKHEDLLKTSTAYQALIKSGKSETEAKTEIAAKAGSVAMAITFPVAALAGKLVENIEKAPLTQMLGKSPGRAVGNMTREFVEEGIQEGTGQFGGNVGQRINVNPEQNLAEGVGEQAIQGAIMGAGSAGAMMVPGAAAKSLSVVGGVAGDAAKAAVGGVLDAARNRADNLRSEAEAASPLSEKNVAAEVAVARQEAPAVAEAVRSLVNDPKIKTAQKQAVQNIADRIQTAFEISPEELAQVNPTIVAAAQASFPDKTPDRFDLMTMAALQAKNEEASQEDRTDAALWLLDQKKRNASFIKEGKNLLGQLDHSRPEVQSFDQFSRVLESVVQTPSMRQTMQWVAEKLEAPKIAENQDLTSPEGIRAVQTTVALAEVAPERVDPGSLDVILKQDRITPILSTEQRQTVHNVASLAEAMKAYADAVAIKLNQENGIDIVSRQIEISGGKKKHQKSLKQHVEDIEAARETGNEKAVRKSVQHLAMFAQSMRNKLDAMNKAITNGDGDDVGYRALGPNNRWLPEDGKQHVYYNPGNNKSRTLARSIAAETAAAVALANSFAREYPQYGISEITVPKLVNEAAIINNKSNDNTVTKAEEGSPQAAQTNDKSQATTSETVSNQSQVELPPSRSQSAPEAPAPQVKTETPVKSEAVKTKEPEAVVRVEQTPEMVGKPTESVVEELKNEPVLETVVSGDQSQKTENIFPNLLRVAGRNMFHVVFRTPKEQRSRLLTDELDNDAEGHPLLAVLNFIKGPFSRIYSITRMGPNQDQIQAFEGLLMLADKAGDAMDARLAKAKDLLQLVLDGKESVNRFVRAKSFNILEDQDGSLVYNAPLRESALLAGIDWLVNTPVGTGWQSAEDLSSSLGLDNVSPDMVSFFNRGMSYDQAIQQLSKRIVEFWGLTTDRKSDLVYSKGIAQAVAIEVLAGMSEAGLLSHELSSQFKDQTGKDYGRIYFDQRSEQTRQLFNDVAGAKELLSRVALVNDPETRVSVGSPIRQVSRTQLRNAIVETTPQQKKALEREQRVPYLPNRLVYDWIQTISENAFVMLMAGTTTLDGLNKNHARSVEGTILGLRAAYNNVRNHMLEVEAHADLNKVDVTTVPTFYPHEITRVGRLQMMGAANPQSDKLAREIFMPTRSMLDLTTQAGLDLFWITAAQGLGVKTEKVGRSEARSQAEAMAATQYADVLKDLKAWVIARNAGKTPALSVGIVEKIRMAAGSKPISMHGIHSLLSIAQLQVAQESGANLKNYEHFNYLEADGKTNGPINALMLMSQGPFSMDWLKAVSRGGVFFGSGNQGKTLNAHIAQDPIDLYGESTNNHKVEMAKLRERLKGQPEVSEQMDALLRMLSALNADISFDEESKELKIGRGVAKNPLTITIYGSGIDGIATKVAGELVELIYEKMSVFAQARNSGSNQSFEGVTYEQFWSDLKALTRNQAIFDKKTGVYKLMVARPAKRSPSQKELDANKTPEGFTIFPDQFEALKNNVKTMFVQPLSDAINTTVMGHVGAVTSAIQTATQVQSIVMRALYRRGIIEKLVDKKLNDTDFKEGDFLSEDELNEILKSTLSMGPVINTGSQSYFMGGSEQGDILGNRDEAGKQKAIVVKRDGKEVSISVPTFFARGLNNDFSVSPLIYGPSLAGVKAIPTLVIGSGDGQMMLNAATLAKIEGVLKVFDGMNMPADKIEEYSNLINGAVHKTWITNPVRAVANSFRDFVNANPFALVMSESDALNTQTNLSKDVALDMTRTMTGNPKPKEIMTTAEFESFVLGLALDLERMADEIDARQQVFREFPMTVDQMASGETPFVQIGSIDTSDAASDLDIVERMNQRYEEILNKKNQDPVKTQVRAEVRTQVSEEVREDVREKISEEVRVTESKAISSLVSEIKDLNADQTELLLASIETLEQSNYRVVQGSASDVDVWLQENNAERYQPGLLDGAHGFVDPVSRLIVLSNNSAETTLHEMIHAATFNKVASYYDEVKGTVLSLSSAERKAVENIEEMMNHWLNNIYPDMYETAQISYQMSVKAIRDHLDAGRKAAALNEYMAWVLSNQELANMAKDTFSYRTIFDMVRDALKAILDFILGKSNSGVRKIKQGESMLSYLRFNTTILMNMPSKGDLLARDHNDVVLYQSKGFGTNDRLSNLRQAFHDKIVIWATTNPLNSFTRKDTVKNEAYLKAATVAQGFVNQGFLSTMQEISTFNEIVAALYVDVELNTNALSAVQDLYDHVIKTLKVEDLMTNVGDPMVDRAQAQNKFDALHGLYGTVKDPKGRSSLLPAFVALGMVDDSFREVLSKLELPKGTQKPGLSGSLDERLESLGTAAMERLSQYLIKSNKNDQNVSQVLDRLVQVLVENTGDTRTYIETQTGNGIEKFDSYLAGQVQNLSRKLYDKADRVAKGNKNVGIRAAAGLVRMVAGMVNETDAANMGLGLTRLIAKHDGLETIKAFVNDIVGRTKENETVYDMITRVRSAVQQVRQQFRDNLPQILGSRFKKPMTKEKWAAAYHGWAKTDLASLQDAYGVAGSLEFIVDDQKLKAEIASLEKQIRAADPRRAQKILIKSQQLAHFMKTGESGFRLQSNAYAVAVQAGERGYVVTKPSETLVNQIDRLVTLYAVQNMEPKFKTALVDLVTNEKEGTLYVLSYLKGLRNVEEENLKDPKARINAYKGHVANQAGQGGSLIVASDSQHARLTLLGYTRIDAYKGSSADRSLGRKSYYFSPVSGQAAYNQGVLQTIHKTVNGIDPDTGFTVGEVMAGRITDPRIVALVDRQLSNQRPTTENLRPVFDETGKTIAFERGVDVTQLARLDRETNLNVAMGMWAGRQFEEKLADRFNEELVENLHKLWVDGQKTADRKKEFINLALDTKDPILNEAWRVIPRHTKQMIEASFGKNEFWVRRDMLNDAVGYRSATIGDMFTGESRWNPKVQMAVKNIALSIFGNEAYTNLVQVERMGQDLVMNAKFLIVVKSVIVPVGNLLANVFQMVNRGVPSRHILKGLGSKTAELNDYIRRRQQEMELQADLLAAEGRKDLTAIRKLGSRIQTIRDSYKSLSIWPLIEAGEFSAISNGVITAEDLALANNRWGDWAEKLAQKVPEGLKTPWRYAFVTRDTALFQGLAKAVQYGDFLGKAILYDDLVLRRKMSQKDALAQVNEAFVNYNRLSGRSRQYLESVGLLWFYNFKLRSVKEAAYMIRNHPLRTLMLAGGPISVGSPVTDNILGLAAQDKVGYSIGPMMGLQSFGLNPWVNLVK